MTTIKNIVESHLPCSCETDKIRHLDSDDAPCPRCNYAEDLVVDLELLVKVHALEDAALHLHSDLLQQHDPLNVENRDHYGTLHSNLPVLVRELEKRFGFERGGR